jgi:hypothetical protein
MTMILALPATNGAVLVGDTRKWFADGSHADGHPKLAKFADGLVTGSGSEPLLDHVAAHSGRRIWAETRHACRSYSGSWDTKRRAS